MSELSVSFNVSVSDKESNELSVSAREISPARLLAVGPSAGFLSFPLTEKVDNISSSLSDPPASRANLTASSRDLKYSPAGLQ